MIEHGWRELLGADGLGSWVVRHGRSAAVFRVSSMPEAAKLAAVAGFEESGALLAVPDRLNVRLSRELWELETHRVELARAVSVDTREHGALADPASDREVQVVVSSQADDVDVEFWCAGFGCPLTADDNAFDRSGTDRRSGCRRSTGQTRWPHAVHFGVSVAWEHVMAPLSAALAADDRIVDESG